MDTTVQISECFTKIWHPYRNCYGFQLTKEEKNYLLGIFMPSLTTSGYITRGPLVYYFVYKPLTGEPQSSKEVY